MVEDTEQLDVWATKQEWQTMMLVLAAGASLLRAESPEVFAQSDLGLRSLLARVMKATGDSERYEAWVKEHGLKGIGDDL